jgi:hypothetical protein
MDEPMDENPHTGHKRGSQPNLLQNSAPATVAEIVTHLTALGLNYWTPDLTDGQRKILLRQLCEDLSGKSEPQIAHACKRYRQNAANRFFPTSGQLLDLMKNPYEDPPRPNRYRSDDGSYPGLGFGGGGCRCDLCMTREHREGFFVAPAERYRQDEAIRIELDAWTRSLVRASIAERHT